MAAQEEPLPLDEMVAAYLTNLEKGKGDIFMRMSAALYRREMHMSAGPPAYAAALKERMAAQMAGPLSEDFNHARHIPIAMRPSLHPPPQSRRRPGTSRKLPPSGLQKQCR